MISPFYKLPPPEPADWGIAVTVCIAALAEMGSIIFLVSDSKISTGESSGDNVAHKQYPVHPNWAALMSGDDIAFVEPITDNVLHRLIERPEAAETMDGVAKEFREAYQEVRRQHATDSVLSHFGISMEQFRANGKAIFGNTFRDVKYELEKVDLGCEFLVAGFDRNGFGSIFTVTNPGISRSRTPVGYWAIGSGAYTALSTMLFHSLNWEASAAKAMYHILEAKFMAESAEGVGRHTLLTILGPGHAISLTDEGVEKARTAWKDFGRPRVPPGAIEQLERTLSKLPTIQRAREHHAATMTKAKAREAGQA